MSFFKASLGPPPSVSRSVTGVSASSPPPLNLPAPETGYYLVAGPPLLEKHENADNVPSSLVRSEIQEKAALTAIYGNSQPLQSRARKSRKGKKSGFSDVTVGNDDRVPWLSRPSALHTIHLSQALEEASLATSSGTVPVFSSILFNISTINNFVSLAAVFDEYRILEIECLITPVFTEIINGSTGSPGSYITAVDIDDSSTPTSLAQLSSYETSVQSKATVSHYHRWVPQYAVAAYAGAFTSYSMTTGWLDCASPNIQHYGIKFGIGVAGVTQEFTYQYRYRCAFRGLH